MSGFTKQSLLAWLHRHKGQAIVLKARHSSLSLTGVCEELEELDACSTEFTACSLRLSVPRAEVSLTLHDTAVALHVLLLDPESGRTALSMPMTLSYGDLIVDLEDAGRREAGGRGSRRKETGLSTPYRLLH